MGEYPVQFCENAKLDALPHALPRELHHQEGFGLAEKSLAANAGFSWISKLCTFEHKYRASENVGP